MIKVEGGRRIYEICFQDCGRVNGHEQGFQGGNYGKSRFIKVCVFVQPCSAGANTWQMRTRVR